MHLFFALALFALTTAQWRDDVSALFAQIQAHHVKPFHATSKAAFEKSVASLDARLPELNDDQVVIELARLGAMVGDGHSGILDFPSGNTYYPLRLRQFSDGLILESTLPQYASSLGARLVGIEATSTDQLNDKMAGVIGHDPGNLGLVQRFGPLLMASSNALHGFGVTQTADRATFHFEKDGKRFDLTLQPMVPFYLLLGYGENDGWVNLRSASPLWLKDTTKNWATYLPEHRAEYVAFNHVLDDKETTLKTFFDSVFSSIDANRAQNLVIDLRLNNGGNNMLLAPILDCIRLRSTIGAKGHLYVITGPYTYSAAQNFVNRIQSVAQPIFVGEPTGENVDAYGDPFVFALPNSGLHFGMATRYWNDLPAQQTATVPDIAVSESSIDYAQGRDPVLEAIWR